MQDLQRAPDERSPLGYRGHVCDDDRDLPLAFTSYTVSVIFLYSRFTAKEKQGMARTITLRYTGTCSNCSKRLARGTTAVWLARGEILCTLCSAGEEIQRSEFILDPGEDAADRWLETHGDRY